MAFRVAGQARNATRTAAPGWLLLKGPRLPVGRRQRGTLMKLRFYQTQVKHELEDHVVTESLRSHPPLSLPEHYYQFIFLESIFTD